MTRQGSQWSIALYAGNSPLVLSPSPNLPTPLLTACDVTDIDAAFIADPFMIHANNRWHLFFESKNLATRLGEIGLAVSDDAIQWRYVRTVLREPFHLSYPCVFAWEGQHYMVPETLGRNAIVLYRATAFPYEWVPVQNLVEGAFADPTPFRFDGLWWMFACPTPFRHDTLELFWSQDLLGPWRPHPANPLVTQKPAIARPGGRVIEWGARLIRYAQDCTPVYGSRLRAFDIARLTATSYEEVELPESPVLAPGQEWNRTGMHHADPHRLSDGSWIACVDGYSYIEAA